MNAAHLHLLLNHAPVFGVFFALVLLGLARLRRSDDLARVGLLALVASALAALAAMLTGDPAEHAVEHLAGVSEHAIHAHEEAAELAAVVTYVGGGAALAALAFFRRPALRRPLSGLALLIALAAFGLMARTANLGGQIRHPEIAGPAPAAAATAAADAGRGEAGDRD
ncbi:MAG TPA: hypothetical protein VFS40_04705 [Gemmatimonadales bacterium]|nr:hypothetical protein [Gemmatimonadales bacterium]